MILYKRYSRKTSIKIKDVMSKPPIVVRSDTSIIDASKIMSDKGVGSLMIIDDRGILIGIVTERDIIHSLARGYACRESRVKDIMSRNLIVAREDEDLDKAIERMREMNIRHLPVIDDQGKPVGMISMRDILDIAGNLLKLIIEHH